MPVGAQPQPKPPAAQHPQVTVPVSVLWGTEDPWEKAGQARVLFEGCPAVTEFIDLPGCGHCPQVVWVGACASAERGLGGLSGLLLLGASRTLQRTPRFLPVHDARP